MTHTTSGPPVVTYYVYLPHYVVTSDIIHVIHWTLRVTELISTHFTPDGLHGLVVVDPRMLKVWVEGGGGEPVGKGTLQ